MSVPLFFPRRVLYASVMVCASPALCVLNFRMPVRAPLCTAFVYIYDASTMALCGLCHLMPPPVMIRLSGRFFFAVPLPLRVLVMITVIFGLLSVCPSPFAFMLQCRGQFIRIPNEVTVPALFCWRVIPATFFLLYGCAYISDVRMRHPPLITKGMSPSRYVLHHCCL